MRGLSSFRLGTTLGRDPVAMMMRSKVSLSSAPPVLVTFSVVELTKPALPDTNCTERCLDNCPKPPVSFFTTLSFHPRSLFKSTLGSPNSTPQFLACSASSSSLATCNSALDGMQPRYRQRTGRSEEHTSELQSRGHLVCRLLLEKKKKKKQNDK